MPDALSKTIPIWCAVLNQVLFPSESSWHNLYTPPQVVSRSEHAQMVALLPSFADALRSLKIPLGDLRSQFSKPLRPIWVTPDSKVMPTSNIFDSFHPIICCTVSRRVTGGELSEGGYIQGAGDDTENWAYGLTPPIFWSNKDALLSTPESDLPGLIENLVESAKATGSDTLALRLVEPTSILFVAPSSKIPAGKDVCQISLLSKATTQATWQTSATTVDVGLGPHKLGSRNLRTALPFIVEFARKVLSGVGSGGTPIVVTCESGKDLSIGVALVLSCLFFNSQGQLDLGKVEKIDKSFIRSRLGWCSTSMPDANPSRATLQSVNSYLMERS